MGCCPSKEAGSKRHDVKGIETGAVQELVARSYDASTAEKLNAVVPLVPVPDDRDGKMPASQAGHIDELMASSVCQRGNMKREDHTQMRVPERGLNFKCGGVDGSTAPEGPSAVSDAASCTMLPNINTSVAPETGPAQEKVQGARHQGLVRQGCCVQQGEAIASKCPPQSPEEEIWARLEQRMASPVSLEVRASVQLRTTHEHVFVANHADGHLELQQQNQGVAHSSTEQEKSSRTKVKRQVVSDCWGGTGDLAQPGQVMRTYLEPPDTREQDQSHEGELKKSVVNKQECSSRSARCCSEGGSHDIAIDDL